MKHIKLLLTWSALSCSLFTLQSSLYASREEPDASGESKTFQFDDEGVDMFDRSEAQQPQQTQSAWGWGKLGGWLREQARGVTGQAQQYTKEAAQTAFDLYRGSDYDKKRLEAENTVISSPYSSAIASDIDDKAVDKLLPKLQLIRNNETRQAYLDEAKRLIKRTADGYLKSLQVTPNPSDDELNDPIKFLRGRLAKILSPLMGRIDASVNDQPLSDASSSDDEDAVATQPIQ